MTHYEYTDEEKTFIQNTLKKHHNLLRKLIEMRDDLLAQDVRNIYRDERDHICDAIYDQALGIREEISFLERCFESQDMFSLNYEAVLEEHKDMVKQIRKAIRHFNSKPKVDYIYG